MAKRARADRRNAAPSPHAASPILEFAARHAMLLALAFVALATIRIAATYTVYNHTSDEPAHIACGMQWLDQGVYRWEAQHPPLARVAMATGPYLSGIRSQNTPPEKFLAMSWEGVAILYAGHHYDRTLALARMGNLPFFWLACAVVYWWGARYFSRTVAVAAIFLFSFVPPVLAHAGLATTDMALTACLGAAFAAGMYWLETPSPGSGAIFGLATGLMILSKFSALVFFPAAAAVALACYWFTAGPAFRIARYAPSFGLAVLVAMLAVWAGYRFSFGDSGIAHLHLPAPELYAGIRQVMQHNAGGQPTYLLGTRGTHGFWLYFPVALAVKTPLAFLGLLFAGIAMVKRQRALWIPLAFCAGILIPAMWSSINIGVRHILPIYIGFSVIAAVALVRMLELAESRRWMLTCAAAALLWLSASSLLSHPDYLPYFNELAGGEPENILADSDLDWGQDLKRLSARLRQVGARGVAFDSYIVGDWEHEHGFPPIYPVDRLRPAVGWNAISMGVLKQTRMVLWADNLKPQERIGKSIFLWYFPPAR
jgi:hypothetical protein